MEKYRFTDDQQALMEHMTIPFAVFQHIDKRIVPLALSDGFCELLGIGDRETAFATMNRDIFRTFILMTRRAWRTTCIGLCGTGTNSTPSIA